MVLNLSSLLSLAVRTSSHSDEQVNDRMFDPLLHLWLSTIFLYLTGFYDSDVWRGRLEEEW